MIEKEQIKKRKSSAKKVALSKFFFCFLRETLMCTRRFLCTSMFLSGNKKKKKKKIAELKYHLIKASKKTAKKEIGALGQALLVLHSLIHFLFMKKFNRTEKGYIFFYEMTKNLIDYWKHFD